MKLTKEKDGLKALGSKELRDKSIELKRELFSLRINSVTSHVKDYSQFKKLRKSVARVLTCLNKQKASQLAGDGRGDN